MRNKKKVCGPCNRGRNCWRHQWPFSTNWKISKLCFFLFYTFIWYEFSQPLLTVTDEQIERLEWRWEKIQIPWTIVKPLEQKNFLPSSFAIFKICEIEGWSQFYEYTSIPSDQEKRGWNDFFLGGKFLIFLIFRYSRSNIEKNDALFTKRERRGSNIVALHPNLINKSLDF